MTDKKRLDRAMQKMAERKENLRKNGIADPSNFKNTIKDMIAPCYKKAVRIVYPKSGGVLFGNTKPEDVKKITTDHPVIYAPSHRGVFDTPRYVAHALPHVYIITGDERVFYCTINEFLLGINGIYFFDRLDPVDRKLMIEICTNLLLSGSRFEKYHSLLLTPEGVPNVYGRENLQLSLGIIKIALNASSYIVPVGNEIRVLWDERGENIIGDINYFKYEDYKEQKLFRPSEDNDLAGMHQKLDKITYNDILTKTDLEKYINFNHFQLNNINLDLEQELIEFLKTHPIIEDFVAKLEMNKNFDITPIMNYLKRCAVIKNYNLRLIECLNELTRRMDKLSGEINRSLDRAYPRTWEQVKKDEEEYINFYLEITKEQGKKGPSSAYEEIDRFINRTTDESIIHKETVQVFGGIKLIMQNHQIFNECIDYSRLLIRK